MLSPVSSKFYTVEFFQIRRASKLLFAREEIVLFVDFFTLYSSIIKFGNVSERGRKVQRVTLQLHTEFQIYLSGHIHHQTL